MTLSAPVHNGEQPTSQHRGVACENSLCLSFEGLLLVDLNQLLSPCQLPVRLYKYLCPTYFEEFSDSIKAYLLSDCAVTLPDKCKQEAHRQAAEGLVALYGEETLPEKVTSLWNISLDAPVHACAESVISLPVLRGRFPTEGR